MPHPGNISISFGKGNHLVLGKGMEKALFYGAPILDGRTYRKHSNNTPVFCEINVRKVSDSFTAFPTNSKLSVVVEYDHNIHAVAIPLRLDCSYFITSFERNGRTQHPSRRASTTGFSVPLSKSLWSKSHNKLTANWPTEEWSKLEVDG